MKLSELSSGRESYELDLAKFIGSSIVQVTGYFSMEFGSPVFKLCNIYFADGTQLGVEGEHDMPYLVEGYPSSPENYTDDIMEALYAEDNPS